MCSYIFHRAALPCHFLMELPASHIFLLLIFTAGSYGVDINKIKGKIKVERYKDDIQYCIFISAFVVTAPGPVDAVAPAPIDVKAPSQGDAHTVVDAPTPYGKT